MHAQRSIEKSNNVHNTATMASKETETKGDSNSSVMLSFLHHPICIWDFFRSG